MSHFHFIGIGGVSMSGIAMILKHRGHQVTGSDRAPSDTTNALEKAGIPVSFPQKADNITPSMDTIVYTAAISPDNPELTAARAGGARVIERSVMLGELLQDYPISVGVAGTHGKTSTSSMLACIHMAAGLDPTFQIGGILASTGTNYRVGSGDHMIIEACEYSDSFLQFRCRYAVVTNVEPEHLDYFGTVENMEASFRKFADIMSPGGALITSPECTPLFEGISTPIVTVSTDTYADVTCTQILRHTESLGSSFRLIVKGEDLGCCDIYVPGRHMIYDALCAAAVALEEGIGFEAIREGLASYRPTMRRFEYKGQFRGAMVVDDYAHHPSEIRSTLKGALEVPHQRLVVVFQPHTYSRTKEFFRGFVEALSLADKVILADIYAAREADPGDIHSSMIADDLRARGVDALYLCSFDEIKDYLKKNITTNDLLITMGAGNVVNIADDLTAGN
ncbi:MAG: UDP-N-acetylmuramate--L-alanine ligase [Lachnospiraceae bacterium]|nr:UDP-N-acetylmuramate--L-alanine ligase [Lachnospiraceae bacterium]